MDSQLRSSSYVSVQGEVAESYATVVLNGVSDQIICIMDG